VETDDRIIGCIRTIAGRELHLEGKSMSRAGSRWCSRSLSIGPGIRG
jgi:hypothetical protein